MAAWSRNRHSLLWGSFCFPLTSVPAAAASSTS
uniref:Uncharacterized protein n=1 Tax=Arundo donax TaxID=35708 RepID=A0A0A9A606_ARUDO